MSKEVNKYTYQCSDIIGCDDPLDTKRDAGRWPVLRQHPMHNRWNRVHVVGDEHEAFLGGRFENRLVRSVQQLTASPLGEMVDLALRRQVLYAGHDSFGHMRVEQEASHCY